MTTTDHPQAMPAPSPRVHVLAGADSRHSMPRLIPTVDAGGGQDIPDSQRVCDAHLSAAVGEQTPEPTNRRTLSIPVPSARAQATAAARPESTPTRVAPLPTDSLNGHTKADAHLRSVVEGSTSANPATPGTTTTVASLGLADPTLALLADVLDDLERTRIANENRLRQLTRTEVDSDGEERGFGLSEDHPDVARLAGVVAGIAALEHQATLNLARVMRAHPLGSWVKAQLGVGEKQAARLLAAIGDPYWNTLHDRPRTVSELWAYAGLHVISADHSRYDTQVRIVGGEQTGDPDQDVNITQGARVGVAAKRRKGEKANWSSNAKMRAWNIAGSMLKAGNREVYDKRKAATEGRLHQTPCVRCGPSGKPAQPGSPWSDAHRHADALRIVSKALLRDLWLAARDIHHGQETVETQNGYAVEESS